MEKVAVITWNLHAGPPRRAQARKDEDDVACDDEELSDSTLRTTLVRVTSCVRWLNRHIRGAGIERAVAVFQEVPDRFHTLLADATDGTWTFVHNAKHHVAIATMGPVEAHGAVAVTTCDSAANHRALLVDVDQLLPWRVRIVGLHWLDRFCRSDEARSEYGRPFWREIRNQWNHANDEHFIVLGDFNESPYDRALVSRNHLWAVRDRDDLSRAPNPQDGGPPLYNPMWRLLGERHSPPHGTFYWDKPEDSGVRWWHIDQILVSPSVVDQLKSVDILVELDGHPLLDKQGKPNKLVASDHLPVIAILGENE